MTQFADPFTAYYSDDLDGTYDCVDRIVLNAYFGIGHNPGGFRHWWQQLYGNDDDLNNDTLRTMAGNFSRSLRGYAKAQGIPLFDCKKGDRKHDIAQNHIPSDPNFTGLFLVIIARAPGLKWNVTRTSNGHPHLEPIKPWPYVNHYHFHFIDPDWGHITIKMSGYPPYPCQIMLNGHEWVDRRLRKQTISKSIEKEGNCFVGGDLTAIDEVSGELIDSSAMPEVKKVIDRWIYTSCLCFGLSMDQQSQTNFRYNYSCYQLEYSRNLIFNNGGILDEVFQGLIDRTRKDLGVEKILTIFGRKRRPYVKNPKSNKTPRVPIKIERIVDESHYDMTVFKVHFGKITLKIYDKSETVLRIEVVVHNVGDLRSGRVIEKLPFMLEKLQNMTNGFLEIIQAAHRAFLSEDDIEQKLRELGILGSIKVAGIDMYQPRIQQVSHSVTRLAVSPCGFEVGDLAEQMAATYPNYDTRKASYDLRKFRAKKLVEKIENSRRYRVSAKGVQQIIGLNTLRTKVIRPLLNGLNQPIHEQAPPNQHAIDLQYTKLRTEMQKTFRMLALIA